MPLAADGVGALLQEFVVGMPAPVGLLADYSHAVLELRPSCECCGQELPPDSREAMICSFECTFCRRCVEERLARRCPNCGGEFAARPVRPAAALVRHPASTVRVHHPEGCAATTG